MVRPRDEFLVVCMMKWMVLIKILLILAFCEFICRVLVSFCRNEYFAIRTCLDFCNILVCVNHFKFCVMTCITSSVFGVFELTCLVLFT